MHNRIVITFLLLIFAVKVQAQNKDQKVFTSDIDHFWMAYDSIQTTRDSVKQLYYIKTLYIDKGTPGLKAFMKARNYTAERWVLLIHRYPRFWNSIRPNTLTVKSKAKDIESSLKKLKKLYPDLKEAKMYFTVGGLRSGGTTRGDMVLIGTEIATGNADTDVSEFPDQWLANVFKEQHDDNIIPLNIHEYVHTQQKGIAASKDLLGQSVCEGACDFITELVMGKPLQSNYLQYGREHERELKEKFKEEMFTMAYSDWLYNGGNASTVADLGYFMGYVICKSYYEQAPDKEQAIKDIIDLNYSDSSAVEDFLQRSKYYDGPLNKAELIKSYEAKIPYVVRIEPLDKDSVADAGVTELRVVFSRPMHKGYSINMGKRGKGYFPVVGITGYSEDKTTLTIKVEMGKEREYEFMLTDKSFKSADGYPFRPYFVRFKTK